MLSSKSIGWCLWCKLQDIVFHISTAWNIMDFTIYACQINLIQFISTFYIFQLLECMSSAKYLFMVFVLVFFFCAVLCHHSFGIHLWFDWTDLCALFAAATHKSDVRVFYLEKHSNGCHFNLLGLKTHRVSIEQEIFATHSLYYSHK